MADARMSLRPRPNRMETTCSTIKGSYTINRKKALNKKKEATKRPTTIEFTEAHGNYIFIINTGVFEEIKKKIMNYFKTDSGQKHRVTDDTEVAHTLTFKAAEGYTVNLYTTSSKTVVNGTLRSKFLPTFRAMIGDINPALVDQINQVTLNIDTSSLIGGTQPIRSSSRKTKPTEAAKLSQQQRKAPRKETKQDNSTVARIKALTVSTVAPKQSTDYSSSSSSSDSDTENQTCHVCSKEVQHDDLALECDKCEDWIHAECDPSLTLDIYQRHNKDKDMEYTCPTCIVTAATPPADNNGDGQLPPPIQNRTVIETPSQNCDPQPCLTDCLEPTSGEKENKETPKEKTPGKEDPKTIHIPDMIITTAAQIENEKQEEQHDKIITPTAQTENEKQEEQPADLEKLAKELETTRTKLEEREKRLDSKEKALSLRDKNLNKKENIEKELIIKLKEARVKLTKIESEKQQIDRYRSLESILNQVLHADNATPPPTDISSTRIEPQHDPRQNTMQTPGAASPTTQQNTQPHNPNQTYNKRQPSPEPSRPGSPSEPMPSNPYTGLHPPLNCTHPQTYIVQQPMPGIEAILQNQQRMMQQMMANQEATTNELSYLITQQQITINLMKGEIKQLRSVKQNTGQSQYMPPKYSRKRPRAPEHCGTPKHYTEMPPYDRTVKQTANSIRNYLPPMFVPLEDHHVLVKVHTTADPTEEKESEHKSTPMYSPEKSKSLQDHDNRKTNTDARDHIRNSANTNPQTANSPQGKTDSNLEETQQAKNREKNENYFLEISPPTHPPP